MNYSDIVEVSKTISELHTHMNPEKFYPINNKCEKIELYNNIEFWSCFTKEIRRKERLRYVYRRRIMPPSYDYQNYIFSIVHYDNENNIDIELNNRLIAYLTNENVCISGYSNLLL